MLVLSRREGENLVFPELDMVLEVLAVKGSTTRLGIQAPAKIRVLRGELADSRVKLDAMVDNLADDHSGKLMHRIRNWLHTANLRMQLIRRYLESDRFEAAADLIQKVVDDFKTIEDGSLIREPITKAAANAPLIAEPSFDAPASHGPHACSALLVEDNANERQLLAGYLREHGFQVTTAGDGSAALDYLSHSALPDLVLLDMMMPECDGATVLRSIRHNESFHNLKVFAVSGTSPANYNISTGPEGVNRWFQKPVDPQTLVREILNELGQPEAEHQDAHAAAAVG